MNKKLYVLFALLVVLYLLLSFGTPTNPNILERYNMDALEYQTMRMAIAIPTIVVWFVALYGFAKMLEYARRIRQSKDGEGFVWIASGLGVLAIGLPINSIIALIASRSVSIDLLPQSVSTIITTHTVIAYQLVAATLLAIGTYKLLKILKDVKFPVRNVAIGAVFLIAIVFVYITNVLSNPSREIPVPPATTATYYMNDALIMTTIVLPYVVAWMLGVFSFIALYTYLKNVKGTLYRKALIKLDLGLSIIIAMSLIQQFLTAAVSARFAWQLGSLVVLVQLLVLLIGVGFAYVALGSKDLTRLEESK